MKIAIVSNLKDGIGLLRDAEILKALLEEWGHSVTTFQWDVEYKSEEKFDLALFCEVFPVHLLKLSETRWIFVNPEWCDGDKQRLIRKHAHKVLTKTREAQRIFEPLFENVHYVGFAARDQLDLSVTRQRKLLHIGGNSVLRGTAAVRDSFCWSRNGNDLNAQLTIVSSALKEEKQLPCVTVLNRVSEEELKYLQNSHLFHLYPSGTEGFGHALHESLSVGAVILTTDAPSMNEIQFAYKIPPVAKTSFGLADVHQVSAIQVREAIEELLTLRPPFSFHPREEFLRENDAFKAAFKAHVDNVGVLPWVEDHWEMPKDTPPAIRRKVEGKTCIAFLGNFAASESTENMVRWALEEGLGHEVIRLQENETTLAAMQEAVALADIFLWVRTPGWLQVPDKDMFAFLMDLPIPSVALHLDLFWYIPEREKLIGRIPFWNCDHVWTADGSNDSGFTDRGVRHHWMKPAASAVYAHRGVRREEYLCDVGFVGAKTYHSEHPWRGELIDFLENTYGIRFKLIEGGLRGHALNDFYESCRVCVGDAFGGGKIPRYWSDRMPETAMRNGFLLSPAIEGLDIPFATFRPESLSDLQEKIDWWLAHEKERREKVADCAAHVLKHDSWTVRMSEILEVVRANPKMCG